MGEDSIRQQELEQKRRDWNTHTTSWQASRLSQAEYCRRHELKFHQFVYWRRKFVPQPNVSISIVQVPAAAVARAAGYGSRPRPCGWHWPRICALKFPPASISRPSSN